MLGQKAQPNVHNRLPEQQTQELPQKDELKQSQTQPKQPQNHKLSDDKTENQAEKRSPSQQQQHKQRKRRKTAQQQTKDRVSLPKLRRSLRPRPRPQRDEQVAKKMRIDRKNNSEFAAKSKSKDSFLQEDGVDGEASLGKISLEDGYWIDDLIQEGVLKKQLMDAKGDYPVVAIQEDSLVDGYWV
ncbi:unnamed protein product [Cylindrotheca closterium]|uniref:Uncharacterized protein n=1 Tax=Cylindrotheca closterium TaxID=2856 RepID=A0AAD2JLJ8_9STRA|nr:unnamed protein product [Cylindrotheca closterium]